MCDVMTAACQQGCLQELEMDSSAVSRQDQLQAHRMVTRISLVALLPLPLHRLAPLLLALSLAQEENSIAWQCQWAASEKKGSAAWRKDLLLARTKVTRTASVSVPQPQP